MNKYYKQINQACFIISILSVAAGFFLTLAMIWEVFPNHQIIEKSWLSVAVFFGAAILIALINNAFSLRLVVREPSGKTETHSNES